jgi:hypothetical protein
MKIILMVLLLAGCGGGNDISTFTRRNPDGTTTECHTWEYRGALHTECKDFQ